MMKKLFSSVIVFSMIFISNSIFAQTVHNVEASMFKYEPANLTIQVGDEVNWNNIAGTHDVNFDIDSQTNESFGNPDNTSLATNSGGDLGSLIFSIPQELTLTTVRLVRMQRMEWLVQLQYLVMTMHPLLKLLVEV